MQRVYFDCNATTALAPEVAFAMRLVLETEFGNPSSVHWAGKPARSAIVDPDSVRKAVHSLAMPFATPQNENLEAENEDDNGQNVAKGRD